MMILKVKTTVYRVFPYSHINTNQLKLPKHWNFPLIKITNMWINSCARRHSYVTIKINHKVIFLVNTHMYNTLHVLFSLFLLKKIFITGGTIGKIPQLKSLILEIQYYIDVFSNNTRRNWIIVELFIQTYMKYFLHWGHYYYYLNMWVK